MMLVEWSRVHPWPHGADDNTIQALQHLYHRFNLSYNFSDVNKVRH